jgi:transposase InsO family protein
MYIVTFILKKTRYITVNPIRTKAEIKAKFEEFVKIISIKSDVVVKRFRLRNDNGGEYRNKKISNLCEKLKISQEFTMPYNPKQNGLAERMNHTLCEMVSCMLKDSQMDKKYWAEAFKTAAYVRNMINNPVNQEKPTYEATIMRVFGCMCFAHVTKERRSKLDDTAVKCKLLGYSEDQRAYIFDRRCF